MDPFLQRRNVSPWTHPVQQVDLLPHLPDEVVFVLVGLQQPEVLLTFSGQLLKDRSPPGFTSYFSCRLISTFLPKYGLKCGARVLLHHVNTDGDFLLVMRNR